MKKRVVSKNKEFDEAPRMFETPVLFDFLNYKGPPVRKTGSEIADHFTLFSVEKKFSDSLSCFLRANVQFKPIPDPLNVCPYFSQCQIYLAEEKISREKSFSVYASDKFNVDTPLIGSSFCCASTVIDPCSLGNKIRILKLSRLDSIRGVENRAAILVLLDQLKVSCEAFPLSQFYYKLRLSETVSDISAIEMFTDFNKNMTSDSPLFHSLFDGVTAHFLVYKPLPSPPSPAKT